MLMESNSSRGVSEYSRLPLRGPDELFQSGEREKKARQSAKIKELWQALRMAGFVTVDEQAEVLGLSRSTAWTIRKANHKSSGLSASILIRMLAAPGLPPAARSKILEYIEEKAAGLYGGSLSQRRRFAARVGMQDGRQAAA
jgi:hypothetical protein